MSVDAVIVAGGNGTRIGGQTKKQFLELDGIPVVVRTLRVFESINDIRNTILIVPDDELSVAIQLLGRYNLEHVRCVAGGSRRQDSVYNGLCALQDPESVVIHDGVRPFVSTGCVQRILAESVLHDAVICALPVTDTIKEVDKEGRIIQTLPRAPLRAVQTPQIFKYHQLKSFMEEFVSYDATDEATFFELKGLPVYCIMGEADNIKITVPEDLHRACDILKRKEHDVQSRNGI